MTNLEIINKINKIQSENHISNNHLRKFIQNHYCELYEEIVRRTNFIIKNFDSIKLNERLYCIEHNITENPKCKMCSNPTKYNRHTHRYDPYCSVKCSQNDHMRIVKTLESKLKKYGKGFSEITKKCKETRLKKYGKFHPDDFELKTKQTKKERYGNENYCNVDKIKNTKKNRYSNENYNNRIKAKSTNIKKYGVENYTNIKKLKETLNKRTEDQQLKINEKRKNTTIERYGVESVSKLESTKIKTRKTNIEKYGVDTILNSKEIRDLTIFSIKSYTYDKNIINNKKFKPLFSKEEFINNRDPKKLWKWKCIKCGEEFFSRYLSAMKKIRCPMCEPRKYRVTQTKILKFITSLKNGLSKKILTDNRTIIKPFELDIYSVYDKFAVEYDGLIFHCYDKTPCVKSVKSINYHMSKTDLCEEKGIRLIHLTDQNMSDNELLCRGLIRHTLNAIKYKKNDFDVRFVDTELKNKFLLKYSFSGIDNSSIAIGTFYKNHLCSMITIRKFKDYIQILNYCQMNNFVVINGMKKMIEFLYKNNQFKQIIFKIDRRYYSPYDFLKNGFKIIKKTSPMMWYMKNNQLFSPLYINKDNIHNFIDNYNDNMSLLKNMISNGYYRYYDCGYYILQIQN